MLLSGARYEEIKKTVVDVFDKLDIHCTPINVFEIAIRLGIKIIPYSSKPQEVRKLMLKQSEDGFSVKRFGKWYIFYNDSKSEGRINNTIMHEVGHIVLDHTEDSELAEAEAKFFAKFALAPPVLIHKYKLTDIYDIAERFEISLEAANYALKFYYKWLNYSGEYYTDYEIKLCKLFGIAI